MTDSSIEILAQMLAARGGRSADPSRLLDRARADLATSGVTKPSKAAAEPRLGEHGLTEADACAVVLALLREVELTAVDVDGVVVLIALLRARSTWQTSLVTDWSKELELSPEQRDAAAGRIESLPRAVAALADRTIRAGAMSLVRDIARTAAFPSHSLSVPVPHAFVERLQWFVFCGALPDAQVVRAAAARAEPDERDAFVAWCGSERLRTWPPRELHSRLQGWREFTALTGHGERVEALLRGIVDKVRKEWPYHFGSVDAEDVVQEVVARVLDPKDPLNKSYAGAGSFGRWLLAVCLDFMRRACQREDHVRRMSTHLDAEGVPALVATGIDVLTSVEVRGVLRAHLRGLEVDAVGLGRLAELHASLSRRFAQRLKDKQDAILARFAQRRPVAEALWPSEAGIAAWDHADVLVTSIAKALGDDEHGAPPEARVPFPTRPDEIAGATLTGLVTPKAAKAMDDKQKLEAVRQVRIKLRAEFASALRRLTPWVRPQAAMG